MSDEYEGEFNNRNEINNNSLKQSNNNNENEIEINKDKNDGNNSIDSIEKDLLGNNDDNKIEKNDEENEERVVKEKEKEKSNEQYDDFDEGNGESYHQLKESKIEMRNEENKNSDGKNDEPNEIGYNNNEENLKKENSDEGKQEEERQAEEKNEEQKQDEEKKNGENDYNDFENNSDNQNNQLNENNYNDFHEEKEINPEKLGNDMVKSESISKALSNRELSSESIKRLKSDLKEEKLEELNDKITHKKTKKKKKQKIISIDDVKEDTKKIKINSPRTLKVMNHLNYTNEDLFFYSFKHYLLDKNPTAVGKPKDIQKQKYNLFLEKRKKIIDEIKKLRNDMIEKGEDILYDKKPTKYINYNINNSKPNSKSSKSIEINI